MKKIFNYNNFNKVAIILIVLSLVVGFYTAFQRISFESNYKTVEISMDFEETEKFANQTDSDIKFWLDKFSELGTESVVIQEETINSLIKDGKKIKTYFVSELSKDLNWEADMPTRLVHDIENNKLSANDVIVTTKDKEVFDYIVKGLKLRYTSEIYDVYEDNGVKFIVLKGIVDDVYYSSSATIYNVFGKSVASIKKVVDSRLLNIGIGYSEEKINLAKDSNLDVILRPINYPRFTGNLVEAYQSENEKYGIIPRVYLAYGKEILGYPENTDEFKEFVKENNISSVLVETGTQRENLKQKGLNELVEDTNYETVRAFTMWDWIRQKYQVYGYNGAEEIENSLYRAVTERNIRFILFKPFFEGSNKYLTDVDEYERTFNSLSDRLDAHDMSFGKANPITDFHVGNLRLGILCVGVALASVFLFNSVFKIKNLFGKILYLLALCSFFAPFVSRNLSSTLFALLAAIAFSGLAIYYFMSMIKKIKTSNKNLGTLQVILKSTIILVVTSLLSLFGAIFIVSILADVKYMLELDIFRGVKAAQLMPILIFLLILIIQFINNNSKNNNLRKTLSPIKKLLDANIKVYYIILAGILMVIGYVYIARTGHETNVQPSELELIIRNFLENVLIARPRTKEFLIAFPALFAAVFAANKKIPFLTEVSMLLAVIGTSSIINTFCHIRTPLYLSIDRTFISIGFGIIIGCIAIIILNGIYKIYTKVQERLN
ncbi:hypothetical protein JYG23_01275 [Sedimentibacter sp. zth1]|uniref:DUF5693 family protein n=1 Tax=Sedimentibacter sp. zth1 TaxID=2816908 RepID=UPI001A919807|nr:DUF5693 family protein [Sedimentibacter sp. zth1]QSX06126.1 hypothetical protein JYG23_01275 [Sedimentibacter sp. zth1]